MAEKINFPIIEGRGLNRNIQEVRWIFSRLAVQASWLLFLCLATAVEYASAQTGSPIPALETIIARMAQARNENQSRFRPYVVTRDYKLSDTEKYQNPGPGGRRCKLRSPELQKLLHPANERHGTGRIHCSPNAGERSGNYERLSVLPTSHRTTMISGFCVKKRPVANAATCSSWSPGAKTSICFAETFGSMPRPT